MGAGAVLLYSLVGTAVVALIVKFTIGLRLSDEGESLGVDESEHAETAYDFAALGGNSAAARVSGKEG